MIEPTETETEGAARPLRRRGPRDPRGGRARTRRSRATRPTPRRCAASTRPARPSARSCARAWGRTPAIRSGPGAATASPRARCRSGVRAHLQRHPAHRAQAPRQLPRRDPAVRGGPGPRRPGDLLHRGPARHERDLRPGGAPGLRATTPPRCCWPPGSTRRAASSSASPTCASTRSCAGCCSSVTAYGDLQRMTQFKDKSAREQRAGAHRASSSTRCSRRRTSCSTAPTRCRWGTTSASTSSWPARSRGASTPPTATCWWSPTTGSRRWARASWTSRTPTSKMSTTSSTEAGLVYIDDEPDAIMRS